MQSLFSCLFALLLYAGDRVQGCGLLPALCKAEEAAETERREDDALEVMQVWQVDSSIAQDVRGVRGKDTVKIRRV